MFLYGRLFTYHNFFFSFSRYKINDPVGENWPHCLHILFFKVNFPFLSPQALEGGHLVRGGIVFEGSAGSTAISIATVAPAFGCKCHVVIPDDAAIEKVFSSAQ